MRTLELDDDKKELRILFPYDKGLVDLVRELPGRRWNPQGKYWSVPPRHAPETLKVLLAHGFSATAEVRELVGEDALQPSLLDEVSRSAELVVGTSSQHAPEAEREGKAYTVSWLNRTVKEVLAEAFPTPVWLEGEVIGFDRNRHKNHVYFQLAEKEDDEDRPRGVVTAVLFASTRDRVLQRIKNAPEPFEICDGLRVRVQVRVDLYPTTGSYQVIIEDLDPSFTLGEIARRQERILAEVRRQGLLDKNRELEFVRPTLRLGLITSYESDAYNDFVNEIEKSGFAFSIDVIDCRVQGDRLENDVLNALAYFSDRQDDFDAVAIVRGGGSRTDLIGFDSLPVAIAVACHPLKVLVGIGHHRDRSVLDFLAHSEKTPTAVAQVLVVRVREEMQALQEAARHVVRVSSANLERERQRCERGALLLARSLQLSIQRAFGRVRIAAERVRAGASRRLDREQHLQLNRARALEERAGRSLTQRRADLIRITEQLPARARSALRHAADRVERQRLRADAADPRRILARGYSWLRDARGRSIKRAADVKAGDVVIARLSDGDVDARVRDVRIDAGSPGESPATDSAPKKKQQGSSPTSPTQTELDLS